MITSQMSKVIDKRSICVFFCENTIQIVTTLCTILQLQFLHCEYEDTTENSPSKIHHGHHLWIPQTVHAFKISSTQTVYNC